MVYDYLLDGKKVTTPGVSKSVNFKVTLIEPEVDPGSAPYLSKAMEIQMVECGESAKIVLPAIKDVDGDFLELKASTGAASKFVTFSASEKAFVINKGST